MTVTRTNMSRAARRLEEADLMVVGTGRRRNKREIPLTMKRYLASTTIKDEMVMRPSGLPDFNTMVEIWQTKS